MKAEMKAVVASIVVIALALTAVSGITYSWFSDEEKATINVTTGIIDIESTNATIAVNGETEVNFVFDKEAAAVVLGTPLKPGDVISVKYDTKNNSTIDAFMVIECNLDVFAGKQTISTEVKSEESVVAPVSGHYVLSKDASYSVEITIEISTDAGNDFADKTGTLTITNKAIQSDAPIAVSTAEDLTDALANEAIKSIEVTNDITIDSAGESVKINRDVTIDAGNNMITLTALNIGNEAQVTIKNGFLNTETVKSGVYVDAGCSIELDNVTYNAAGYGLYPRGDAASVTVKNSTVTATAMAIATNSKVLDNYGVIITIEDSKITTKSSDFDNVAVMINVAGTLNISKSTITGDRQALIVRAGTANVVDTDFISTGKYVEKTGSNRDSDIWDTGNEVSSATIVVGSLSLDGDSAYKANASLSLDEDCTIKNETHAEKTLIIAQDGKNGYEASVSLSSEATTPINAIKKTGFVDGTENTTTISPGETVTVSMKP